jgi:Pyruvate/2-oxoacid:ferredoxin oxidoreductase gamma subunit
VKPPQAAEFKLEEVTTPGITIRLSGDAGQGLESSGAGFTLAAARAGLHVLGTPDYRSRVRGGNNFFQVRLGNSPVYSQPHEINVLLALTADAVAMHADTVMEGGVVLAPAESLSTTHCCERGTSRLFSAACRNWQNSTATG